MSTAKRPPPTRHDPAGLPFAVLFDFGVELGSLLNRPVAIDQENGAVCAMTSSAIFGRLDAVATSIATEPAKLGGPGCSPRNLDQFFTAKRIAFRSYRIVEDYFDLALHQLIEPSAGDGSFLELMPPGTLAFDVERLHPRVFRADFLTTTVVSYRPIGVIGNPPFGRRSDLAIAFFNRAARHAAFIAFILPRTARKIWFQNQLDRFFHLLHEEVLPDNSFFLDGKRCDVPAVFQIWVRRQQFREVVPEKTQHPDFEFLPEKDKRKAHFAIQRIGANAGRVHRDFSKAFSSTYFVRVIRGDVEAIMTMLQPRFAQVAGNVAGKPSLAKTEIVSLYDEWIRVNLARSVPKSRES